MANDNLDETKLKAIIANLRKRFNENLERRIKHADDPLKFAASETELFVALDELQGVTVQPELYQVLVAKKVPKILMDVLAHENKDISTKVINILNELTDPEDNHETVALFDLIWALCKDESGIDRIVHNLNRFNPEDKEESQAIISSLGIIENMIEFESDMGKTGNPTLAGWIFGQLKKSLSYNPIKLPMMELLIVWLRSDSENFNDFNKLGLPLLLRQVDYYRRVAPKSSEENEYVEQVFSCLSEALLGEEDSRRVFYEEEGIDLIELILREKRPSIYKSGMKFNTLKLFCILVTSCDELSYVTKCCEQFIKKLGLKVLFPIFKNPKLALNERIKRREYKPTLNETEECTCGIILAIMKHCKNTEMIQRVLLKFAVSNYEKLDRLIDLHEQYHDRVSAEAGNNISKSSKGEDEEEKVLVSGAYVTLRAVNYILLLVCYLGNQYETYDPGSGETLTNRIKKVLNSKPMVKAQVIVDVGKHIKEVSDIEEEKNSLELLLKYFEQLDQVEVGKN